MNKRFQPGSGRFDLIPPGAERRLAQLFERDASTFGPRDWEQNVPLSAFVNMAKDALNRLHARDTSDDWAARVTWAMIGYMHVEALVRAGRLPSELADMPAPDPILVATVVPMLEASPAPLLEAPSAPTPPTPPMLPGKS